MSHRDASADDVLAGISDPRTRRMYELYAAGRTLEEVADRVGLSRERVRCVLRQAGVPMRSKREAHARRRERIAGERSEEICAAFAESREIGEVARRLGISSRIVRDVVHANFSPAERRRPVEHLSRWPQKFTDDELIGFLREAARRGADTVTMSIYMEHARGKRTPRGRPWPVPTSFIKRFGSWRAALAAAGLAASPVGPRAGSLKFDEALCVDALRAAALALGGRPTAEGYEEFARSLDGAYPSLGTMRNRFGTWRQALAAAGL